ncbi:uncharacterized protein LOC143195678 [Rhynchophorus ferrugineus]|uniref:uncharacterized protein LOC143195678 n=1 Tax=Rhynchophorus ferrugineus TaxID=354439 RepID=UPI003FCE5E3B
MAAEIVKLQLFEEASMPSQLIVIESRESSQTDAQTDAALMPEWVTCTRALVPRRPPRPLHQSACARPPFRGVRAGCRKRHGRWRPVERALLPCFSASPLSGRFDSSRSRGIVVVVVDHRVILTVSTAALKRCRVSSSSSWLTYYPFTNLKRMDS